MAEGNKHEMLEDIMVVLKEMRVEVDGNKYREEEKVEIMEDVLVLQ